MQEWAESATGIRDKNIGTKIVRPNMNENQNQVLELAMSTVFTSLVKPLEHCFEQLISTFTTKFVTLLDDFENRLTSELRKRDNCITDLSAKIDVMQKEREEDKQEIIELKAKITENISIKDSDAFAVIQEGNKTVTDWRDEPDADDDYSTVDDEFSEGENIDLLVIGDSCVSHLDVNRMYRGKRNKLICIRGGMIDDIRNAIKKTYAHHSITNCVVHVGTNHTPTEEPNVVSAKIISLMKELRSNMPQTGLHFSAILPKYNSSWLPGIDTINKRVCMASRVLGYSFIQHKRFASEGDINSLLLSKDGIHPSYKGVAQLAMDIMH